MNTPYTPKQKRQWMNTQCTHLHETDAWPIDTLQKQLGLFAGWAIEFEGKTGAIKALWRQYTFKDFEHVREAVALVCTLAAQQNHHPDVQFSYKQLKVSWCTHSAKGITNNDWACAAQLDHQVLNQVE